MSGQLQWLKEEKDKERKDESHWRLTGSGDIEVPSQVPLASLFSFLSFLFLPLRIGSCVLVVGVTSVMLLLMQCTQRCAVCRGTRRVRQSTQTQSVRWMVGTSNGIISISSIRSSSSRCRPLVRLVEK